MTIIQEEELEESLQVTSLLPQAIKHVIREFPKMIMKAPEEILQSPEVLNNRPVLSPAKLSEQEHMISIA
jgi:hypothetical protein